MVLTLIGESLIAGAAAQTVATEGEGHRRVLRTTGRSLYPSRRVARPCMRAGTLTTIEVARGSGS